MNTPDSNYTPKQHRTGLSRLTKSGGIQKSKTLLELLPNTTPNTRSFKKIYSKPFQEIFSPNTSAAEASTSASSSKIQLTKKKLKFAAVKYLEENNNKIKEEAKVDYSELNEEQLAKVIEERKEKVQIFERHEAEKKEVNELIIKWKEAGVSVYEELQKMYPDKTEEELFNRNGIDPDAFL